MNARGTTLEPDAAPARTSGVGSTELLIPAGALVHLRRALRTEVNPLAATHVLYNAGFGSGAAIALGFESTVEGDPAELPEERFWEALGRYLGERGWGRLETRRVHPGLAMLRSPDWAEADSTGAEDQPGCHFTCGILAHLLGRVAEAPIAVLEVRCRSRGDEGCEFLYGSEAAVHEAYGLLIEGASLDETLAHL